MRKFAELFASRAGASVLQAILFFLVARDSGPRLFGEISVVMAAATFVSVVAEFGTATYLSRVCALNDSPRVRAVLRLNAIATLTLIVIVVASATAVEVMNVTTQALAFGAISLACAIDRYVEVTLSVPVAHGKMTPVAVSLGLRRVVALVVYLLLPIPDTALRFGLALLSGQLVAAIYSEVIVVRRARKCDSRTALREVARSSIPYFIATISSQFRWLDSALVSVAAGSYVAGLYSAADKLVRPMLLVSQTMQTLFLPRSSRLPADAARRDAHRLYIAAGAVFVILIPAIVWARELVELTLGDQFADAAVPLRVLLASLPLIALASPLASLLQGQGEEKFVGRNSVLFALVVVAGVFVGALAAGAVGAAAGLAIASTICTASLMARVETLKNARRESV